MKALQLLAAAGVVAVWAAPALAENMTVDAPIMAVTVYPQGASITREFQFDLPVGTSVLIIDNLPIGIDTSSIRVEGIGDDATIQSVTAQRGMTDDNAGNPEREELIEQIEALREQLRSIDNERAGLEAQRQFINNLIAEGPGGFAQLLGGDGAGVDQWDEAWTVIGQGIFEIQEALQDLSAQQREIEEEIEEILDEISSLPTIPAHVEVLIEASAASPAEGTMILTYQIGNARWAPAYDAMLDTGGADDEPMLELVRRAQIVQNTGEDWNDVELTLSTSRPAGGTQAPSVSAAILSIFDQSRRFAEPAPAPAMEAMAPGFADEGAEAAIGGGRVAEAQAIADFGDFRADYIIPTAVTIASGGGERSVRIATEEVEARLFIQAAPRFSEQAFLTAAFTIDTGAPVLAGRVTLFRDEAYVGTGNLAFANPGEEIELGFGPDDQVRVDWMLVNRDTGERGLLTRVRFDEREYMATVTNNHSRAIEITILDRIPVSNDERVVVERLPQTTEPTEEDVDGRRGVLAWTYEYDPGEIREIVNAYAVTWPTDFNVFGLD